MDNLKFTKCDCKIHSWYTMKMYDLNNKKTFLLILDLWKMQELFVVTNSDESSWKVGLGTGLDEQIEILLNKLIKWFFLTVFQMRNDMLKMYA